MSILSKKERRSSGRINLDWSVCLWHEATGNFYNGESVNISATGALIKLPLTVPLRISDSVTVKFPESEDPGRENSTPEKVFSATIVRVNRGQSILEANQSVAITFQE